MFSFVTKTELKASRKSHILRQNRNKTAEKQDLIVIVVH